MRDLGGACSGSALSDRCAVLAFIDEVMIGGRIANAGTYIASDHVEHHTPGGIGTESFTSFITKENTAYATVHHLIADGNFVFTLSAGESGGTAFGFYDLFRVSGKQIVEHWDSKRVVPASSASGLPIF